MTRRRLRIIVDTPGQTFAVRGWRADALIREAGHRAVFSGIARGWVLDLARLPDVAAWLEYRNVPYSVTERSDAQ